MPLTDLSVDLTYLRDHSVNQKIGQQKLFKLKDKEKKKKEKNTGIPTDSVDSVSIILNHMGDNNMEDTVDSVLDHKNKSLSQ